MKKEKRKKQYFAQNLVRQVTLWNGEYEAGKWSKKWFIATNAEKLASVFLFQ